MRAQKTAADRCKPQVRPGPRDINEILIESEERVRRFLQARESMPAGVVRLKKRVANPQTR